MQRSSVANATMFWPIVAVVALVDLVTKQIALARLQLSDSLTISGEWLRMTLVRNPGAAFGLSVGPASRYVFMVLTVVALAILWRLYLATRPGDRLRILALALVCGGAIGNLVDRIRFVEGVVDFIDVGISDVTRWPTFNVADMAVSVGAFLLAWVLWEEDRDVTAEVVPVAVASPVREPGDA